MFEQKRITAAYKRAERMEIDDNTKLVFISDCHRGTGGGDDHFAQNQLLFYYAIQTYNREGYTYIELGDGDELWKNRNMDRIKYEYSRLFELLSDMQRDGKYKMIYGNHDMVKKRYRWVRENLSEFRDNMCTEATKLFPSINVVESIVLTEKNTHMEIVLLHGHQADFFNDRLWKFSRFLVRYVWRPLELIGVKDPISTSLNFRKRDKVEKTLIKWCEENKKAMIAGHTHRLMYPLPGQTPYFNDGSCVHPRYITAIEIENGAISIVKWEANVGNAGVLCVTREALCGPYSIKDYAGPAHAHSN